MNMVHCLASHIINIYLCGAIYSEHALHGGCPVLRLVYTLYRVVHMPAKLLTTFTLIMFSCISYAVLLWYIQWMATGEVVSFSFCKHSALASIDPTMNIQAYHVICISLYYAFTDQYQIANILP